MGIHVRVFSIRISSCFFPLLLSILRTFFLGLTLTLHFPASPPILILQSPLESLISSGRSSRSSEVTPRCYYSPGYGSDAVAFGSSPINTSLPHGQLHSRLSFVFHLHLVAMLCRHVCVTLCIYGFYLFITRFY